MKYNVLMRLAHWLSGILIILLLILGIYMTRLPDSAAKWDWYALHKLLGMVALFVVIGRVLIRLGSKIPKMPEEISRSERAIASLAVCFLYALMLIMPISGYIMSVASGRSILFFTMVVPDIIGVNPAFAAKAHFIHVNIYYLFIAIIALHILASLKHLVTDKVNLFKRIWV